MANNVFANDLEIACKAADGKSIAAFPDPCFTPPAPTAGWVLIPYANTAYAKDTTNASKTVFITNKPIMKKDISFFKTSTGNEPAAGPKGQSTGVKKGKAYFTSWSMNVKVEGQNVDRHTDGMTHNHGSKAGNTGAWKYWDTSIFGDPCKNEFKRVEKSCGGMKKRKNAKFYQSNWVDVGKKVKWKTKHCKGLNIKPTWGKLGEYKIPKPGKASQAISNLANNLGGGVINKVIDAVEDQVMNILIGKLAKFGAKQVVKKVPVAGWVWQASTAADDISEIGYLKDQFTAAKSQIESIKNQVRNIDKKVMEITDALRRGDMGKAASGYADLQRTIAIADPCLRARKCMLVPMRETKEEPKNPQSRANSGGNGVNRGCCTGQTGHHLIPGSYVKGNCRGYNYDNAPVVCSEGPYGEASGGSHNALHKNLKGAIQGYADKTNKTISYEDARDAAVTSHVKTFPLSGCSQDCLKSQLDKYHKDRAKCTDNSTLNVSDKIEDDRNPKLSNIL